MSRRSLRRWIERSTLAAFPRRMSASTQKPGMPHRLSPEHQLERDSVYRVLAVIAEYLDAHIPPTSAGGLAVALQRAYEARDLRGLRMARADLVAMAHAASTAQRRALDVLLRERAGTSLDDVSERELRRIRQIRARGRVTGEEQYYLVRERVEFIMDDPERADEYRDLCALLQAFEERARRARP